MTVAIDAFRNHQERLKEAAVVTRNHLRAVVEVGRKAQMVVDHPGWQTYVDHITAIKDDIQARRDRLVKDMAETDALGDALNKLKIQCISLDSELKALGKAIDLIPTMIQRAADSVELMERAKQDSPAAEE